MTVAVATSSLDQDLAAGIAGLGLALDAPARAKLLAYVALLAKWNRTYNLTAIREPERMVTHHLLDALAVLPYLRSALPGERPNAVSSEVPTEAPTDVPTEAPTELRTDLPNALKAAIPATRTLRVLDVGAGGGIPGIPLAIARPDWVVTMVDSNHKKVAFLTQAAIELGLRNVTAHATRIEAFAPAARFDVVISRAFSDLETFVQAAIDQVAPGGLLVAMKGVHPVEELALLPKNIEVVAAPALQVPGVDAARHLIVMRRRVA